MVVVRPNGARLSLRQRQPMQTVAQQRSRQGRGSPWVCRRGSRLLHPRVRVRPWISPHTCAPGAQPPVTLLCNPLVP